MAVVRTTNPPTRRTVEAVLLGMALALGALSQYLIDNAQQRPYLNDILLYVGVPGVIAVGLHLLIRREAPYADPIFLPAVVALNQLGIAMIHRIDLGKIDDRSYPPLAGKQLVWTVVGMCFAAVVLYFVRDHRSLVRYTYTAMVCGIVLLILPLFPVIGSERNGSRIWISLGLFGFQPAEATKILLAIFFAGYLVTARDSLSLVGKKFLGLRFPRARDLGPILIAWLLSLGVLILQRDLGTSLLLFGLFVAVLYIATERLSWVAIGMTLFLVSTFAAWVFFDHVKVRAQGWLDPFSDPYKSTAQILSAQFGLASGGLFGTGWGLGSPGVTPMASSDFIVSSLGEELGLVGLMAIIALYAILCERGLRTAIGLRDGFGKLLVSGLAFSIALQVFVVAGGVTRLIPLTGLTTPLLAYGGSSLLSNWIIVALLIRTSHAARRPHVPESTTPALSPAVPAPQAEVGA